MKKRKSWEDLQKLALKVFTAGSEKSKQRHYLILMVEEFEGNNRFLSALLGNRDLIRKAVKNLSKQLETPKE